MALYPFSKQVSAKGKDHDGDYSLLDFSQLIVFVQWNKKKKKPNVRNLE